MRSIPCKLVVNPDQLSGLNATLEAFAGACNFVAEYGRKNKVFHKFSLHTRTYRDIRTIYGLSANLACRAIARVAPKLSSKLTRNGTFRPGSVDYDRHIFSFRHKDCTVSLSTVVGRCRFSMSIGRYQRESLAGKDPKAAVLVKRGDVFFLNIIVDDENAPLRPSDKVLGVDLGLTDIAALSDGTKFSGRKLTDNRLQRAKVRRSLQVKAAKAGRTGRRGRHRCLRRLRGRESRFQKWVNHNISKTIVAKAVESGSAIALEDLTGIRNRINRKPDSKRRRGLQNRWSFHQLRQFITYKAARAGIAVRVVNPRNTSRTCHICGEVGLRSGKVFNCTSHGRFDADINAALNISRLGANVSRPEQSKVALPVGRDGQVESLPQNGDILRLALAVKI